MGNSKGKNSRDDVHNEMQQKDNSKSDNSNRTSENSSSERENKVEKEGILTNQAQKNKSPGMGNSEGKNSRDDVHNEMQQKENEQDQVIKTEEQRTDSQEQDAAKSQKKEFKLDFEESRTCYVLLALNGILMVLGIVLIHLTTDISMAQPCDLKKSLDLLGLDINDLCAYNDIMDKLSTLSYFGIGMVFVDFIFVLMLSTPFKRDYFCGFIAVVAFIFSIVMLIFYTDVLEIIKEKKDTDYVQIKAKVLNLLEKNYTSDNISSSDAISNNLNKFFIKYDCCAINQVQGTTNDFDSTPWCTTSGSCQATASQIPKTCCNYVSEEDYENAPTTCHSSVSPGTYKSNCMIPIRLLSVTNIEDYKLSLLQFSLLIIGTLELCRFAEVIFVLMSRREYDCCRKRQNEKKTHPYPQDLEKGNQNNDHGATNKKSNDSKADDLRTEDENPNNVNG